MSVSGVSCSNCVYSCVNFVGGTLVALKNKVVCVATAILDFVLPVNAVTKSREFHLIPTFVEKFMGTVYYPSHVISSGGEIQESDAKYGKYVKMVRTIGAKLAENCPRKNLDFEFKVVNANSVNAWCLPGGKIGVHIGLIEKMENETSAFGLDRSFTIEEKIAAVLSHEITHASARHTGRILEFRIFLYAVIKTVQYVICSLLMRNYNMRKDKEDDNQHGILVAITAYVIDKIASFILGTVTLCKGRWHELESDKYGMHLMWETYKHGDSHEFSKDSVRSAIWVQEYFAKNFNPETGHGWLDWALNLFMSHPTPHERLEANKQTWIELSSKTM